MIKFGEKLATQLSSGFCLELIGDVGAGKTALTKALVQALGSTDEVTSPSFTINNRYQLPKGKVVSHYDFYRLGEAGVVGQELIEDLMAPTTSVIIEWAATVNQILPPNRVQIKIQTLADGKRELEINGLEGKI